MSKINLFILSLSNSRTFSGVDRYIEMLLMGLKCNKNINLYWVDLQNNYSLIFPRQEIVHNCCRITIPMPENYSGVIQEEYWSNSYNEYLFRATKHLFVNKDDILIHIHSISMIDFALFLRDKKNIRCKILTHLHCIPWKVYYDINMPLFNELYFFTQKDVFIGKLKDRLLTSSVELRAYEESDIVVCLTNNARSFLTQNIGISEGKIRLVGNGIEDYCRRERRFRVKSALNFLYVGSFNKSKGVLFILESISELKRDGVDVSLTLVGNYTDSFLEELHSKYSHLNINLKGVISFEELIPIYEESDVGVMASVHEQASYVSIEMSMFGLPMIVSSVDGLDEIFEDGVNCLKVNTSYSVKEGFKVDVSHMKEKMNLLIRDVKLRERISLNIRKLYLEKFRIEKMIDRTLEVYCEIMKM